MRFDDLGDLDFCRYVIYTGSPTWADPANPTELCGEPCDPGQEFCPAHNNDDEEQEWPPDE